MSIIYCLVARNSNIVLSEYTEHQGNFQQISRIILRKLSKETKLTIDYNNFQFHYLNDSDLEISFLCLTENISFEYAFGFMYDCKKLFLERYNLNKVKTACSYQLQEFADTFKDLIIYYNTRPSITKFGNDLSSLPSARNVEIKKVDDILVNELKIDLYAVNSNTMKKNYQSLNFMAQKIKYQENYKKIKYGVLVAIGLLIFLFIVKNLV